MPGLVNTHHHGWGLTTFQLGVDGRPVSSPGSSTSAQMRSLDPYLDTLWADLRNIRSGVTTVLHAASAATGRTTKGRRASKLRAHADSGIRAAYARPHARPEHVRLPGRRDVPRVAPGGLGKRLAGDARRELSPLSAPTEFFALLESSSKDRVRRRTRRLTIMICPIAPQWCSDDLLRRIRSEATDSDMRDPPPLPGVAVPARVRHARLRHGHGRTTSGSSASSSARSRSGTPSGSDRKDMDICAATRVRRSATTRARTCACASASSLRRVCSRRA